ncbi:hypothetical protein Tco_1211877 [Tanacetum coccineum]
MALEDFLKVVSTAESKITALEKKETDLKQTQIQKEEEPEAQGRKSQDELYFFSTRIGTISAKKSTSSHDKGQREGKAPMISEETPKKSKEQILQEEASLAEAIRLDSLQKEEEAKQIHLDSLLAQRIAEKKS